jgi:hypothetical protein
VAAASAGWWHTAYAVKHSAVIMAGRLALW